MRLSKVPEIAALQLETGSKRCCFCEELLPADRAKSRMPSCHCGAPECNRSYHRIYRAYRSEKLWANGMTSNGLLPKRGFEFAQFGHHRDEAAH